MPLRSHQESTQSVVHKNMRMGLGAGGVAQSPDKLQWLSGVYESLREFDTEYSQLNGWPRSIKLTTVKPSGCLDPQTVILTANLGNVPLQELYDKYADSQTKKEDLTAPGKFWYDMRDGASVYVMDCDNQPQRITKFFDNGESEVVVVQIDGNDVVCTPNHKFLVVRDGSNDWVCAADLREGDQIVGY